MSATATKERPILFSGEMVRAILAGTKTQTRRIVGHLPNDGGTCYVEQTDGTWWPYRSIDGDSLDDGNGCEVPRNCPYGIPGDRLWVRETWALVPIKGGWMGPIYYADGDGAFDEIEDGWDFCGPWRPSIHMRREYSRINLEITAIRVERLQDISEGDAVAEGVEPFITSAGYLVVEEGGGTYEIGEDFVHGIPKVGDEGLAGKVVHVQPRPAEQFWDARQSYRNLWESINGLGSWDANPWVWVVEFNRETGE